MDQIENGPEQETHEQGSPPEAEEAARRLVILKYVVVRALVGPPREIVEHWHQHWPRNEWEELGQDAEKQCKEYWQALHDEGLWQYLSPWELQYASHTFLSMTHEDQVDASWRVESVQVLLWALGFLPQLPSYDTMADHDLLRTFPTEDVDEFIGSAALRPREEIERERDIAELWHWRSRTRQLGESGDFVPDELTQALGLESYDDIVRFTAPFLDSEGSIPPCIDDDFPARGKAYRDLSDQEWHEVESIAVQRHFTLNWLCGYAPENRWDETPTHT
jgi:hypothetical protein